MKLNFKHKMHRIFAIICVKRIIYYFYYWVLSKTLYIWMNIMSLKVDLIVKYLRQLLDCIHCSQRYSVRCYGYDILILMVRHRNQKNINESLQLCYYFYDLLLWLLSYCSDLFWSKSRIYSSNMASLLWKQKKRFVIILNTKTGQQF